MKLIYDGKVIAEITTNHSMTVEEAIKVHGYDVYDPDDCEKAYDEGFEAAYIDDNANYQIDVENIEMEY